MEDEAQGVEEGGASTINAELIKSYLTFARSAIRAHRLLIATVAVAGLILTALVVKFVPRTYSCTTVMMTVENAVLDGTSGGRPLVGAEGLLMRHENLESLIRETGLVQKYYPRRPPLLRLKDRVSQALLGPPGDKIVMAILVGTLENKLSVTTKNDTLEIKVDWSDAATAAELTEAAKQAFLRLRHRAEISAFQEKMGILDTHATKMREEIDVLAAQMKETLAARAAEMAKESTKAGAKGIGAGLSPLLAPRPSRSTAAPDSVLPELRAKLANERQRLTAAENERSARISAERAKLDELKLRFTPSHPQVMTQEERFAVASNVPSELALLRAEVSDLEAQIKQRDAMFRSGPSAGGGSVSGRAAPAAAAEMLPADILRLLEREDVDPALSAQMSGAVVRYGSLRDEVRGAKLALDTAQAAFNHRYQVVIPVEQPNRPSKPNVVVLGVAGVVLSLLLAFLIPVLLELRRGVLIERWQVDHFQLPVLAELRLPKHSDR